MHSSRMRNDPSLTASRSIRGERGHACRGRGAVFAGGACLGVHGGGACPPQWTEFMTHACENITFQQLLLRVVKIYQIVAKQ